MCVAPVSSLDSAERSRHEADRSDTAMEYEVNGGKQSLIGD